MSDNPLKSPVLNRGTPPDAFLAELIAWGRTAPDEIFAWNEGSDIYTSVADALGPYPTLPYRRAVMLEVMRVLAGFESSWHWGAGVDPHNPTSNTPETTEAGAWQVSADSMHFGPELRELVISAAHATDAATFQRIMKSDHRLAMNYIARLLRRTVNHNGPVKRHEIDPWLKRGAVDAFMAQLGPRPRAAAGFAAPAVAPGAGRAHYLERLPRPAKEGINKGLTSPSASFMSSLLGLPRDSFTGDCQDPDIDAFTKLVDTRRVGPIRVTGLKIALRSLEQVFADVHSELPDLHALIGTQGMLCCRYKKIGGRIVREPSNHSWGSAVDLTVGGVLDEQGDNQVQRGLLILARYFNAHGWYWGAAFPTEDAMHFEVSREQLQKWHEAGAF